MNKKFIVTSALAFSLLAGSLTAFAAPHTTKTLSVNTTTTAKPSTSTMMKKKVTATQTTKKSVKKATTGTTAQ